MKKITTTKTIEEVTGYEALDGTFFRSAEECEKYEESAVGIIKARAKEYLIGETTIYGLLNEGSDECGVEIYNIADKDAAATISQLIYIKCGERDTCSVDEYIGKELIIFWSYDEDYAWFYTIDSLTKSIKNNYKNAIERYAERKGE